MGRAFGGTFILFVTVLAVILFCAPSAYALETGRHSLNLGHDESFELTLEGTAPFTVTSTNPNVLLVNGQASDTVNSTSVTISGIRYNGYPAAGERFFGRDTKFDCFNWPSHATLE